MVLQRNQSLTQKIVNLSVTKTS